MVYLFIRAKNIKMNINSVRLSNASLVGVRYPLKPLIIGSQNFLFFEQTKLILKSQNAV